MITTIIFDIGGVLLKGSFTSFLEKASEFLGIGKEKVNVKKEVWDNLQKGNFSLEEVMRETFQIQISDEKMETPA